jgi:hypothetical protein
VEFISLIFRLGVILAIFSFIWGILKFGFVLLRGGVPMSYPLGLAFKTLQYLLIADVAILFCTDNPNGNLSTSITTGLILLMYFIGKVQNMQFKAMMSIQIQGRSLTEGPKPKMGMEFGIVALAMAVFGFLLWKPEFAANAISNWFYKSIIDIESTPIFTNLRIHIQDRRFFLYHRNAASHVQCLECNLFRKSFRKKPGPQSKSKPP